MESENAAVESSSALSRTKAKLETLQKESAAAATAAETTAASLRVDLEEKSKLAEESTQRATEA